MTRRCGQGIYLGAEVLVRGRYRGVIVGHAQYEHEWIVLVYNGATEAVHVEDMEAIK